jgi:hypothetical protein
MMAMALLPSAPSMAVAPLPSVPCSNLPRSGFSCLLRFQRLLFGVFPVLLCLFQRSYPLIRLVERILCLLSCIPLCVQIASQLPLIMLLASQILIGSCKIRLCLLLCASGLLFRSEQLVAFNISFWTWPKSERMT